LVARDDLDDGRILGRGAQLQLEAPFQGFWIHPEDQPKFEGEGPLLEESAQEAQEHREVRRDAFKVERTDRVKERRLRRVLGVVDSVAAPEELIGERLGPVVGDLADLEESTTWSAHDEAISELLGTAIIRTREPDFQRLQPGGLTFPAAEEIAEDA